jgi:hypothetical protein
VAGRRQKPKSRQWTIAVNGDKLWKWTLRFAGLAGIAWETTVEKSDRPELLIVFAAMVGLDKVLEWDARRRDGKTDEKSS